MTKINLNKIIKIKMFIKKPLYRIYLILSINIFFTFQIEQKYYNIGTNCNYKFDNLFDNSKKLLLEIMHGKLPFKIETKSKITFDIDFIERINNNIPCPYTIRSLESDQRKNGIFLGAGINLLNLKEDDMDKIFKNLTIFSSDEKILIKSFCGKSGNEANELVKNGKRISNIRKFNEAVINYLIEKVSSTNDFNSLQNYFKTPYMNGIISAYITTSKYQNDLQKFAFNNFTSTSYIVQHLFEGAPFSRIIQSKLISMMDGNIKYNNNHIFFVVPMLFEEKEINNIKSLINSFTTSLYTDFNLNNNKISIIGYNENKLKYILDYNINKNRELEELLNLNSLSKAKSINLTQIYEFVSDLFEKNKNKEIFENKILTLFLNISIPYSNYYIKPNDIINEYKKKGIQTIPFINKPDKMKRPKNDIINYNLFHDFNNPFNVGQLKLAVSNMHINIDLSNFDSEENIMKIIENINSNDIDSPIYIEVNIKQGKNESEYYEISFDIKKTDGYNIFISDNNPYPNIKDYTHKFIKYDNNLNPKIKIKTYLKKQFYIGIEGVLYFNMTIRRKYSENNDIIINEGEYMEQEYDISFSFKDDTIKNLETFTSDYKPHSNLLKNEVQNDVTLDNVLKYFTRGIDLSNTDDGAFFNYNLFIYLFSNSYLITTVYKNQENNYYMGKYIELTTNTPFSLREEGLNQLIINKLYPFLDGNNNTFIGKNAPAITFNENELKLIYNITNRKYVLEISNLLNRTSNCKDFRELNAEMKFILLCLYFQNPKDSLTIKLIKELGHKEPKYSEVLTTLINRNKSPGNLTKFLISFISNLDQQTKFEKVLISVMMGQSFILSDSGIKLVEDFYNELTKAKAKISLSIYDTLKSKNKIKTIIPFYSKKLTKIEMINEYRKEHLNMREKYNYTEEQYMDFDKIINYLLSQLSKYDKGIKKEIFIVCDENIYDNYYINNKLINLNYDKHKELRKYQIKLILISTKNYEKGELPELFNLKTESNQIAPYTIYENYFHVNDLTKTDEYMDDLGIMAKDSTIKLNLGERYINDFYQGKLNFYELNVEDFTNDVIVIKANLSNFNFYYSFDNPFPNSYLDQKLNQISGEDTIVITDIKENKNIYLGIESKNEVPKQVIEIFSCESYYSNKQYQNCKFVDDHRYLWYAFIFLTAIFVIGHTIYFYKPTHSINKNQLNVY